MSRVRNNRRNQNAKRQRARRRSAFILLGCLLSAVALLGCDAAPRAILGDGVASSQTRAVGDFSEIEFDGTGELVFAPGPADTIEISADANLLPLIRTHREEDRLLIRFAAAIDPRLPIVIRVTAPAVDRVALGGAVAARLESLDQPRLRIEAQGACSAILAGRVDSLSVRAWAASRVDGTRLRADALDAKLAGAADVRVRAARTLEVALTGASQLTYDGSPAVTKAVAPGCYLRRNQP